MSRGRAIPFQSAYPSGVGPRTGRWTAGPRTGRWRIEFWLVALLSIFAKAALGRCRIHLQIENDIVFSDRHYTQGIQLIDWGCTVDGDGVELPRLRGLLDAINRSSRSAVYADDAADHAQSTSLALGQGAFEVGLVAGQTIYTSEDTRVQSVVPGQRPYAAWLYAGALFRTTTRDGRATLGFLGGVTGPAALGHEIQNGWHRLLGIDETMGWSGQTPGRSTPGVMVTLEQELVLLNDVGRHYLDVPFKARAVFGNVVSAMEIGVAGRVGLLGSPFLAGVESALVSADPKLRVDAASTHQVYTTLGIVARGVFYHFSLDGPLIYSDGPTVEKYSLVLDAQAGVALALPQMNLSLMLVLRSPEYQSNTETFPHRFWIAQVGLVEW